MTSTSTLICFDCHAEVPRRGVAQKRCGACAELRQLTRNAERYDAVRQCWGTCTKCGGQVESGQRVCQPCKATRIKARNQQVSIARATADGRVYHPWQPAKPRVRPSWAERKQQETESRRLKAIARRSTPEAIREADAKAIQTQSRQVEDRRRKQEREVARERRIRQRPWTAPGLSDAEQFVLRYRGDVIFNLKEMMRAAMKRTRQGHDLDEHIRPYVLNNKDVHSVEVFVGYTAHDLKRHLEGQFIDGMTWAAFLVGEIHINHRHAPTEFDLSEAEQLREAWQLNNLRPIWAGETTNARQAEAPRRSSIATRNARRKTPRQLGIPETTPQT